ncbi:hypothetical protein L9F63_008390, partial [Diploptera punctata]
MFSIHVRLNKFRGDRDFRTIKRKICDSDSIFSPEFEYDIGFSPSRKVSERQEFTHLENCDVPLAYIMAPCDHKPELNFHYLPGQHPGFGPFAIFPTAQWLDTAAYMGYPWPEYFRRPTELCKLPSTCSTSIIKSTGSASDFYGLHQHPHASPAAGVGLVAGGAFPTVPPPAPPPGYLPPLLGYPPPPPPPPGTDPLLQSEKLLLSQTANKHPSAFSLAVTTTSASTPPSFPPVALGLAVPPPPVAKVSPPPPASSPTTTARASSDDASDTGEDTIDVVKSAFQQVRPHVGGGPERRRSPPKSPEPVTTRPTSLQTHKTD